MTIGIYIKDKAFLDFFCRTFATILRFRRNRLLNHLKFVPNHRLENLFYQLFNFS